MKRTWVVCALLVPLATWAQQKPAPAVVPEYYRLLEDGNPADLFEAKGEALWTQKRGPKRASLEACDLGKGPGVVKGAWVEMPRYFADTKKVQDLESRLLTCMEVLQGFNAAEIANRWAIRRIAAPLTVAGMAAQIAWAKAEPQREELA